MKHNNANPINIGIDTSQSQLDIFIRPNNIFFSVSNDSKGIAEAIKRITGFASDRVLIESTERLELPFAIAAYDANLPIVICNAAKVRFFAKSTGRLAKTDKLDAQDIANYGESARPDLSSIKPKKLREISDLLTLRSHT